MYFSLTPDIQYDQKPISYPFSESDYITVNNFFRRYKVDDQLFGYLMFYDQYTVQDGVKLETIANDYYGSPFYDWVIVLSNNYINPLFAFPLTTYELEKSILDKYSEPYDTHHYETIEIKSGYKEDDLDVIALEGGTIVDSSFHSKPFTYYNGSGYTTLLAGQASRPVSNYEYEVAENEKKRKIYILKNTYFNRFIEEFKTRNLYTESSNYISNVLKRTG
mgnify:CR=1 FL=1|tara:strand:- start:532 stop:1191 length:660 start_codon:yes stop_codon:yes gene_type:complete